jgi:uncharacterized protein YbaA (DUF1428 family)
MSYVDGFVLTVPRKNLANYKKIAALGGKIWKRYGALEYCECVGDDMKAPIGIPFPKLVKPKAGEVVVFSWIVYKSKADRNKINAKVMKDPDLCAHMNTNNMPFDCKRMSWGGFKTIVKLG